MKTNNTKGGGMIVQDRDPWYNEVISIVKYF